MARDAGTKTDAPPSDRSPDREEKVEQDGPESPVGQEQGGQTPSENPGRTGAAGLAESEKKAKPRRRPVAKAAEGTAAEVTGVDKAAADAALEGAEAPAKPKRSRKPRTDAPAGSRQAEAPAPRRRRHGASDPTGRVIVRAQARFVRSSARKARLVADHVRGKDVDQARAILAFSPRTVADDWRKLLESAIANAEHNHDLVGDDLRVLNATADEGPTLKRFRPRAMGRATRIRKRTAHLTITLTPKD